MSVPNLPDKEFVDDINRKHDRWVEKQAPLDKEIKKNTRKRVKDSPPKSVERSSVLRPTVKNHGRDKANKSTKRVNE